MEQYNKSSTACSIILCWLVRHVVKITLWLFLIFYKKKAITILLYLHTSSYLSMSSLQWSDQNQMLYSRWLLSMEDNSIPLSINWREIGSCWSSLLWKNCCFTLNLMPVISPGAFLQTALPSTQFSVYIITKDSSSSGTSTAICPC